MKDTYIRIRLSERDKDLIRQQADKVSMNMSEYIVNSIRQEGKVMVTPIYKNTLATMFAIGFEEIAVTFFHDNKVLLLHAEDFLSGGKYYDFRNYDVRRFEREFVCILRFC